MSEYQYYEFHAIDKPLTERQMGELRKLSTRAEITTTSFTNEYHWGDFHGSPRSMMEKYFDAFLYYANWGTHWFMLRLPAKKELADFLRIDDKLLKVAAALDTSKPQSAASRADLSRWIKSLPSAKKDKLLLQLVEGDSLHPRESLIQYYRQSQAEKLASKTTKTHAVVRRTAGELLTAADLR